MDNTPINLATKFLTDVPIVKSQEKKNDPIFQIKPLVSGEKKRSVVI